MQKSRHPPPRFAGPGTPVAAGAAFVGAVAFGCCLLALAVAPPVLGQSKYLTPQEAKLLPPEHAFRLAARSIDPATIEARFTIAPGYYMYRDKMSFKVEPASAAVAANLPEGKVKDDPFFGRVVTYRDQVVVRLPVTGATPGQTLTLIADSQGCADAGVCYPPNVQKVTLALPRTAGAPGMLIEATPSKKSWLQ